MSVYKALDIPYPPTKRDLKHARSRLLREPRDELTEFKWYLINNLEKLLKKGVDKPR